MSERLGQGAGLGISFVGAGAIAVVAMQLLRQVAGAFDPRPEVQALTALTAALAGLTLERTRHVLTRRAQEREREERLAGWLGAWPPGTISELDPVALGVFPPRADLEIGEGLLPPYFGRDADDAVCGALGERGLVLIVGPARSGKSRTAYEAVRTVAGDRRLLAPEDGKALSEMIRANELEHRRDDVLWLDDLERFLPSLRGPELRALSSGRYHVIATIRERAYRELAEASGERGQRGRRLLARARIIHLDAAPSTGEAEAAAHVYPAEDLSQGIGPALSARWDDQHTVSEPRSAPASEVAETRFRPDLVLGVALVLTVASAAVLAATIGGRGFSAPSVGDQLTGIREDAAEAGGTVVSSRSVELHGLETRSHIVVVRSEPDADELRIYDEEEGELEGMLTFRPTAPEFVYGTLELVAVDDLDADGDQELVADYLIQDPPLTIVRVPIAVTWDEAARDYALWPLLTKPPALARGYRGGRLTTGPSFQNAYTLSEPDADHALRGYGVSSLIVDRDSDLLVTGVVEFAPPPVYSAHLAINLHAIGLREPRPELHRFCDPLGSTTVFVQQIAQDLNSSYESELRRLAPIAARRLDGVEGLHGECSGGE